MMTTIILTLVLLIVVASALSTKGNDELKANDTLNQRKDDKF